MHALVPRRWPVDFERGASHPSLARRIQALRAVGTSGAASPALGAPVVLATARAGSVVVFDDERAHWFDGAPPEMPTDLASLRTHAASARSVMWGELVELRVATTGTERALRATHRSGESWSVPLAPAQVAAVQRALDRVDGCLHRELGRRPIPDVRLIAVVALVAMILSGDVGALLVPAGLAAVWPSTAALAALGTMACGAALLAALRADSFGGAAAVLPLALLAAVGVVGLWRAWRRVRAHAGIDAPRDREPRAALLVLGGLLAIVVVVVSVAAAGLSPARVAQLPVVGTLAITLGGLAAALCTTSGRRTRVTAAVLGLAAVLVAAPAVWSSDAFGARSDRFTHTRAAARETSRVALPRTSSSLRLSPGGDWFLARSFEVDEDEEARFPYTLGSARGARREVRALAADFAGDRQLLALFPAGDALDLELQDVDSSGVLWRQTLPRVGRPILAVSPRDRAWAVSGIDESTGSPVVVTGHIESSSPTVRHLRPADAASLTMGVVSVGERLVVPAYDLRGRNGMLEAFGLVPLRVSLWEIDDGGRRQIGEVDGFPQCGPAEGGYAECIVRQRGRSEVWTLGPRAELSRVASLPLGDLARSSLGPGRRITSVRGRRSVVIIDAAARRIADVDVGPDSAYAMAASSVPGRLAVLWRSNAGTTIAFYDVP